MLLGGHRAGVGLWLIYSVWRTSAWTSAGAFLVDRLEWQDRWAAMWDWLLIGWIAGVITTGCFAAYAEWSALESWLSPPPVRGQGDPGEHDRHRFW